MQNLYVHTFYLERPERGDSWLKLKLMANGGSWSTYERDPSLVGSLGSARRYNIDFCPALAALVSPVKNIIFLVVHYFTL
jgi:hypothetical protein